MKNGFSLIMAIMFILIVSTLGLMALRFSTLTVKQNTNSYLKTQAELLAISAAEIALLEMQKTNYTKKCLDGIDIEYGILKATVKISYFDQDLKSLCTEKKMMDQGVEPLTSKKPGTNDNVAMFDIVVESKDKNLTGPIRFHKQTVQRP
ncbi:hypothetical protein F1B92_08325 [Campylobacter sp. FMV-PI01]|uniref:Type II secretion system protein n=1 Tax=Campylobacter portucalensis TaxID=2608384 RepID=A0A6L5WMY7_9BACT|nr:hypothetical protein [Campylobacter portucalensis]MSN97163.1 hypothetical protein [Campylobacter portucalensis]